MLLSLRDITKAYPIGAGWLGRPKAFVKALDGVSLEVGPGEVLGVVGESGCGKSTLGRCAVGLHDPTEGSVVWDGEDLRGMGKDRRREVRHKVQMVFQNPFASLDPRQKAGDILEEALELRRGLRREGLRGEAGDLLVQVGLSERDLRKHPHEFSGGQRQRIAIARALAGSPELIVLDEPVSSLDVSVQASILNLLADLNRSRGIGYLFISHDLQVIGYLSDRVIVMYLGKALEEGPAKEVLDRPRHPYTALLLAASRGGKTGGFGEPPSPVSPPSGCPFHPRCPHAEDRCKAEKQSLADGGAGVRVACWKWDRL